MLLSSQVFLKYLEESSRSGREEENAQRRGRKSGDLNLIVTVDPHEPAEQSSRIHLKEPDFPVRK